MVRYAKKRGHTVSVTTNGTALSRTIPDVLESGLDRIVFSIDRVNYEDKDTVGHPQINGLLADIRKLRTARSNRSSPLISLQTTMHRGGMQDCLDIVEYAGVTGVDRVNLVRLDTYNTEGLERMTLEEEMHLYCKAERPGKQLGVGIDTNYAKLDGSMRVLYKRAR